MNSYANPNLRSQFDANPTFKTVEQEAAYLRERQAVKQFYVYSMTKDVAGQITTQEIITIEQGTDFHCQFMTVSAYSYDDAVATSFPIPNVLGATDWAGRGVSVSIVDTGAGVELTNGFVPLELIGAPGYGLNFQNPYPLNYLFSRNAKIRFDLRNRDVSTRTHTIGIALHGFKILTPSL